MKAAPGYQRIRYTVPLYYGGYVYDAFRYGIADEKEKKSMM